MIDKYIIHNINQEDVESCSNCGNVFRVELIKESSDYNDFGFRYCPFCGTVKDQLAF